MKNMGWRIAITFILGFLTTLPFVVLEGYFTSGFASGAPVSVFLFLLVVASGIVFLMTSIANDSLTARTNRWGLSITLKGLGTLLLITAWTQMVVDQMPCFLGGGGC